MRKTALAILLLTACQLSARDLVSESSRSASEAWVSRRFASTQELYAVESALGPRLALIEGQTNNWRQAYAWGNHAGAGYLLGSAWNTWLSTNTYVKTELDQAALAALAAFAATNKTKVVHSSVSSNVWATLGIGGTVTVHTVVAAQVTDYDRLVVTDPNGDFSGIYSKQDGGLHWYAADWRRISIMPGYVGSILWTSGDTEAYGGDDTTPPFEFQEALNGFPLPIPTTAYALKDGYATNSVPYVLTTGNVWQAVGEAKGSAEAAQLAADQAATLINYHTTLDAAPHAGKFVTPAQMTNNTSHVLSQWYAADGSLTQQIVRVGAEIWTNRWPAGVAGAITNGQNNVVLGTSTINGDLTITPSGIGTAFWTMNRFDGQPLFHFAQVYGGGSWDLEIKRNAFLGYVSALYLKRDGAIGINTDTPSSALDVKIADDGDGVKYNGFRVRIGDTNLFAVSSNGVVSCASTCTAAVVVSQGPVFFGPVINGRQMFLDGDGTNAWTVNVNSVTNAW